MNNELIGVISNEDELKGVIEDDSFDVMVQIVESGPRGLTGPPGPPGTANYNDLTNKPSIESIELTGNKTFEDLGIISITKSDIINIF